MIHLATSDGHPLLTGDDRLLVAELRQQGIACAPLEWRTGPIPAPMDAVVIRSCWDYHLYPEEFLAWLDRLERSDVRMANGYRAIRSTMHKRYLLQLQEAGAAFIPPTELVEKGSPASLGSVASKLGAAAVVVKPAVSLSAHLTWRTEAPRSSGDEARFREQVAHSDTLVQEYVPRVVSEGELSMVFLGGAYSHAVVKHPGTGDFRVQAEHGGVVRPATPRRCHVDAAARALGAVDPAAHYARIDGIPAGSDLLLMEVEMIDPVLFFSLAPGAARRFGMLLGDWLGAAHRQ